MTRKEELKKLFKDNLPKGLPKSTKKILDNAAEKFAETLQNYYELPCSLGETVTDIKEYFDGTENPQEYRYEVKKISVMQDGDEIVYLINDEVQCKKADFGKTIFFGAEGIEQAEKAKAEKIAVSPWIWESNPDGSLNFKFAELERTLQQMRSAVFAGRSIRF